MIIPVEGFAGQRRPVQNLATERVCLGPLSECRCRPSALVSA